MDMALVSSSERPGIVMAIIERTALHYGVEVEALFCAGDRSQTVVRARYTAYFVLRRVMKYSYPELGRLLGSTGHTTAHRACRVVQERMRASGQEHGEISQLLSWACHTARVQECGDD